MNATTYEMMTDFVRKYIGEKKKLYICDVGSYDANGTFKLLFKKQKYFGLDIIEGPNVDIVSKYLYNYPLVDESFDVVVSASTIEHVQDMYKWILELKRITKKKGLICIIAPSFFRTDHKHPFDCWRIYSDGMIFLLKEVAGLKLLKIKMSTPSRNEIYCMGVAQKE